MSPTKCPMLICRFRNCSLLQVSTRLKEALGPSEEQIQREDIEQHLNCRSAAVADAASDDNSIQRTSTYCRWAVDTSWIVMQRVLCREKNFVILHSPHQESCGIIIRKCASETFFENGSTEEYSVHHSAYGCHMKTYTCLGIFSWKLWLDF